MSCVNFCYQALGQLQLPRYIFIYVGARLKVVADGAMLRDTAGRPGQVPRCLPVYQVLHYFLQTVHQYPAPSPYLRVLLLLMASRIAQNRASECCGVFHVCGGVYSVRFGPRMSLYCCNTFCDLAALDEYSTLSVVVNIMCAVYLEEAVWCKLPFCLFAS